MKRRIILLAASALALVSCGSAKQFADASQNQQFRDEVYYNPNGSGAERQARTIAKVEEGEELLMMVGEFVDDTPESDILADHHIIRDGYVAVTAHNFDNGDPVEAGRLSANGFDEDFQ